MYMFACLPTPLACLPDDCLTTIACLPDRSPLSHLPAALQGRWPLFDELQALDPEVYRSLVQASTGVNRLAWLLQPIATQRLLLMLCLRWA